MVQKWVRPIKNGVIEISQIGRHAPPGGAPYEVFASIRIFAVRNVTGRHTKAKLPAQKGARNSGAAPERYA